MEQFATEEQQVEAIKKFWKENGIAILLGAAIGLGGLWGWRYYNTQQLEQAEKASIAYQQTIEALNADAEGFTQAINFVNANQDNGYAVLTSLQLAKEAVTRSDFAEAEKHLTFVVESSEQSAVKNLSRMRLARVQFAQEQFDAALATLELVDAEAFDARVAEVKGDIFAAQQLVDKARAAYSEALSGNAGNRLVQMKLDNLAVQTNG